MDTHCPDLTVCDGLTSLSLTDKPYLMNADIVVCSTGFDATAVAYALNKRGHRRVAILLGGVVAWKIQHPEIYERLAGTGAVRLTPRSARRKT